MAASRPADRKDQIIAAASELFRGHGYHRVSVTQIAAAVGITAPALYRHFKNKQALLEAVVQDGFDILEAASSQPEDLKELLSASAAMSSRRRGLPLLWQREARYLPAESREAMRVRLKAFADRYASLIRAERPDLRERDDHLLAWAVIAINGSVSTHRAPMAITQLTALLDELSTRAARTSLGDSATDRPSTLPSDGSRVGITIPRREQLLAEATRLFDERGYLAVNTEDIGEADGTTGPNVYNHFEAKIDLLAAAVYRGGERRRLGVEQVMAQSTTQREALDGLLAAHIDFAITERHLIGLLISELDQLPPKFRKVCEQNQREYLDLWAQVLDGVRPGLSAAEARITAWAALAVAENSVRIRSLRGRPDLADRLTEICTAVLLD